MATPNDRTPLLPLTPADGTHQDTVVLNDYGGMRLEERTRTSKAGKTSVRMSLSIKATPILHNLNGLELGMGPANAIRDLLEKQTKDIGQPAAASTLLRRKEWARQFAAGVPQAVARYAGGKTGPKPPNQTVRLGNDSGRLAEGWFVRQNPKEGSWTINVPANRFDPTTWGGSTASLRAWIDRFVQLVPALAEPRSILEDGGFVRAVATSKPVVLLNEANLRIWKAYAGAARSIARTFGSLV